MMKRIALLLACLLLMAAPVLAEEVELAEGDNAGMNVSYEGTWFRIDGPEEWSFEVFLPSAWRVEDLSKLADQAAENADRQQINYADNLYYAVTGGNGVWGLTVGRTECEAPADIAALQEAHADAEIVNIDGVDFLRYTDEELDAVMLLLPKGNAVYEIALLPASDSDFTPWLEEIIPTIKVIEVIESAE